jgi:Zn-dependent oligopeptidase
VQVRDYERLGLNLDIDTRKKVEEMKTRCGELSIKFQRNLNEENTILHFTRAELDGMPEDFIKVSLPDRLNIKQYFRFPPRHSQFLLVTCSEPRCLPSIIFIFSLQSLKEVEGAAGKVEVTLRYPHVFPIMKMCEVRLLSQSQ